MTPEIRETPIRAELVGVSGRHIAGACHGPEIIGLMNQLWPIIRTHATSHKGINWVAFDSDGTIFTGVEADLPDPAAVGLQLRRIRIERYAYWKHVGPYDKLAELHVAMQKGIAQRGLRRLDPALEIYGHWSEDESKLETEIIYPVAR